MPRYKVYETCIATFSSIVVANDSEDAKKVYDKTNPDSKLEFISERLDGTKLEVNRLIRRKKK
jgi:hypothetical protein